VSAGQDYYTEQFASDPKWDYVVLGPSAKEKSDKATYSFASSHMVFDLEAPQLYAYYINPNQTYTNVRVDINFENRGVNSQNVSLVCQYNKSEGWYEFSVGSDGLWYLWGVTIDSSGDVNYNRMVNGGSKAVKTGKEINEYGMACNGQKISLFINGSEVKGSPVTDKKYVFRSGNVGFNISSLNPIPVKVEVDWFKISQPQ
jgi:hypothetical protein